ncbi:tetratricopeptide repeat protein [Neisseria gonorrhoeae]
MFEAADLYRELLSERPDLVYPRFDLGVMLFEDKQYREALVQLHRARRCCRPICGSLHGNISVRRKRCRRGILRSI